MSNYPTKAILLCHARTGSTLMGSLLASHPQIHWDGEYIKRIRKWSGIKKLFKLLIRRWPWMYFYFRASKVKKDIYSCKMFPHYVINLPAVIHQLSQQNWLIIHLCRRDVFKNALSWLVAKNTGYFRNAINEKPISRLVLEPETLLLKIQEIIEINQLERLSLLAVPHLTFYYEDDLAAPDRWPETAGRVFDALGLDHAPVQSRVTKTWGSPYSEIIENYSELIEIIRHSKFYHLLPPDQQTRAGACTH